MNNPKMNKIIDRLYARNHINIKEGFIKDRKVLRDFSGEFEKFLNKKKFSNFDEMGVDNGKIFVEVDGDWKHEHLHFKQLAKEFFEKKGYEIAMGEVVTKEYSDDSYVANHYIAIIESTTINSEEVEDIVSDEEPYNEFMNTLDNTASESVVTRFKSMLKRFSDTPLESIQMSKVVPRSGIDFFLGSKLVVFILKDGMSTDEDDNKGVVAVLTLPNGRVHLIDTEVYESKEYYINTILYNMHQLEAISKEIWIGDVVLR